MKINEIEFVPVRFRNGHLGFVSFVLDDIIYVGSVGVYSRPDGRGIRLVYPQISNMGVKYPTVYPTRRDFGSEIEDAIYSEIVKLLPK